MTDKISLRREIAFKKKQHSMDDLMRWSETIRQRIESTLLFQQARGILLYHSMPDEVQTHSMLQNWQEDKQCYLPQIDNNLLNIRKYEGENSLRKGAMGIWEPTGTRCTDYSLIDLVIVPGVAFDKEGHRLGRGKGYYDRLLPQIQAPTIGICFHFQLLDKIPTESFDINMSYVITEKLGL